MEIDLRRQFARCRFAPERNDDDDDDDDGEESTPGLFLVSDSSRVRPLMRRMSWGAPRDRFATTT